jgi:hypothetical protein
LSRKHSAPCLRGKSPADLSMEEIDQLPYLRYDLAGSPFLANQQKNWSWLCSIFFDEIILKPLVPDRVKDDLEKRFSCKDYEPGNMLVFLGQKNPLKRLWWTSNGMWPIQTWQAATLNLWPITGIHWNLSFEH